MSQYIYKHIFENGADLDLVFSQRKQDEKEELQEPHPLVIQPNAWM